MKKSLFLCVFAIVAVCLVFPIFNVFAQVKVKVTDKTGKTVIENYLDTLVYTGADSSMVIRLRDPVSLSSSEKTIKVKIDGVEKEIGAISVELNTITPVSPTPTPAPVTKPDPPFPVCWWGPKPTDKSGLVTYLDGTGGDAQKWADWLKATPGDLDWAWGEYKKSNP